MFISKGYNGVYDLYFLNPITSKRTKISTGTTNLKQAEKFKKSFSIEDHSNPSNNIEENCIKTLEDLKVVALEYAKTNYSSNTLELYNLSIKDLIRIIGNRPLFNLRLKDFEAFKVKRINEVSRTTVNIEIRTIKAIFNLAFKFGYVEQNLTKGLTQLSIPEKEKLSFNDSDVSGLIKAIDKPVLKDIVVFTLHTGCRISEVLNLQVKDINLINNIIIIRNKPNFKTKTGKMRLLPIPEKLISLLNEKCQFLKPDSYLFSNLYGERYNSDYISQSFKKSIRKIRLPEKYHFHCLRHTYITKLIKNGVNINFVKELAGHSDIQTTMGYIHIEVEDLRKAINTIKFAVKV